MITYWYVYVVKDGVVLFLYEDGMWSSLFPNLFLSLEDASLMSAIYGGEVGSFTITLKDMP